jgi:hypothetical protein
MSDLNELQDPAIEALRERARQLDTDIDAARRRLEIATACRDELLEMVAVLSRKPRSRKPRIVTEPADREPTPVLNAPALPFTFAPAFVPDGAA